MKTHVKINFNGTRYVEFDSINTVNEMHEEFFRIKAKDRLFCKGISDGEILLINLDNVDFITVKEI